MKKFFSVFLTGFLAFSLAGCGGGISGDTASGNGVSDNSGTSAEISMGEWNTEAYMIPFWKSDRMVGESVLLVSENGGSPQGQLLFVPEEIESVVSYDIVGKRTVEYTEGTDFRIEGNTIIASGDSMPFMTEKQLSGEEKTEGFDYSQIPSTDAGLYLPFTESTGFIERQIYVTYTHAAGWEAETPSYAGETLTKTAEKLRNGESLNLFVYGDSISTGANSTGYLNVYPYADSWPESVRKGLEQQYGGQINLLNKAVGGWTSEDAIKSSETVGWVGGEQITQTGISGTLKEMPDYTPDLAILGFGMNDASNGISRKTYKLYMQRIMTVIRERNPDCEFILLGTMIANPKAYNQSKGQIEYYNELSELAAENPGTVAVNIGRMHMDMLERGKRYADMTGNNVNHPNDFMASVYVMNILSLLIS